MPKSKRNKLVSLTATKKKGRERKEGLVSAIQNAIDEYSKVYVFRYENMRNEKFKDLRDELKNDAKFFLGSNKVMKVALGRDAADEYQDELHLVSERLKGFCGVVATGKSQEEVEEAFARYEEEEFARAGAKATETIEYPEGPVEGPMGPIVHTLEPSLRANGMPVKLNKGVVELAGDFTLCKEGERLTPQQAVLLRTFGVRMATFRLVLDSVWTKDGGLEILNEPEEGEDDSEGEEEEGVFDDGVPMLPKHLK